MVQEKIPVGISRCLMGEEVRYNGGHKLSKYCRDYLGNWFEFVDTCPEVEIGLPIPREPMRVVDTGAGIRVLEIKDSSNDHTQALSDLAESKRDEINQLCGFIFMQNSPSCGAFRVKAYHPNGNILHTNAKGAFAERVQQNTPWLPVEEAGRLSDPQLRENFVSRVFVLSELQQLISEELSRKTIIEFHARHKYMLMARSQRHYRVVGKLLSRAGAYSPELLAIRYRKLLMNGMSRLAGRGGNANALQHMQGYLKNKLDKEAKKELADLIDSYRRGEVPLIAPLVMLRHYSGLGGDYYSQQRLLEPHPNELGLNNEI